MKDLLIIFLLILLNSFFSMAEIALISARKSKLAGRVKNGSKAAQCALDLSNQPDKFLSTIQIGITLIGILTGLYSGDALAADFDSQLKAWGVHATYSRALGQLIIVVAVTYFSIVLGELVPKRIGLAIADKVAVVMAYPMYWLSKLTWPFVWFLSKSTSFFTRMLPFVKNDNRVTEDEVRSIIQEGANSGEVQEVEQDIMERALVLGDQTVESLMTHRKDIVFMDIGMTAGEVEHVLKDSMYAAYPVIDGDPENVKGMVKLKDLVLTLGKPDFSLTRIVHPPVFFPENMTVYRALEQLRQSRLNRALVCDEFGSFEGIISLKDILEGLVGTLTEVSEEPDIIERADKKSWLVSGQCLFYDFLEYFDCEDEYTTDYNTVSGLILDQLEHIPTEGEKLEWKGFSFEVVDMDGNRIDKVLVERLEPSSAA